MATLQEIIAKREELTKTNPNATNVDARNALSTTPVPNATSTTTSTVAQPTPTPAPTTPIPSTVNVGDMMGGKTSEERQAIRNGVATPTPTPVAQTTPVTPTPEPVQAPTPVPTTVTPDTAGKISETKAQNEAQMALNQQQAQLREQERNKIAQETKIANTPTTASAIYNAILTKQDIPVEQKASGAYRVANNRYQRVNQYVNMTPSEVNNAFTSGKLVEGSQTFDDLKSINPKLAQDAINLRKVNGNKTNIFTYVNNPDGTKRKVNNLENSFTDQYEEDHPDIIEQLKAVYNTPTYEQMQSQINTPEVKSVQDKATAIELEINALENAKSSVDKDIEKELAGTGATSSRIALEKSVRKQEIQKELDAKTRDYTTYYNKATNLINRNTEMFKYSQEQNKAMQSALAGVYTDKYKNDLALKQKQAEFEQGLAQQAQLANDPTTAITTMIDEYKKLGIPFTRSTQQVIQDFENSGKDLATYLSELQGTIQSKPEYQQAQARKMAEGTAYQTFGDKVYKMNPDGSLTLTNIDPRSAPTPTKPEWKQDASGNWYNANSTTSPSSQVSTGIKVIGNIVPVTAGNKTVRLDKVGAGGFESAINQLTIAGIPIVVGQGARDQTATIKEMADRYGIAFNASNPAETAQKLRTAGHQVADPGKSNHESGMAIDVYGSSNLDAVTPEQEKILNANGWYSAGIPGDAGHFEYKGVQGTGTQGTGFTDSDIAILGSVTKLDKQGKQTLKDNGLTERDWANYNAGLLPATAKQKEDAQNIVNKVDDILTGDWTDAVGIAKSMIFTGGGSDRKVTELKVQALKDLLAMANLDKIKGAMSDKDIEFLRNTATYLSTDLSESEFENTLGEIKNRYGKIVSGIPTTQISSNNVQTNTGALQTTQQTGGNDPLGIR